MPFFAPNPNAFLPWPPPQYGQFPGGNWLMRQWGNALQRTPWAVQPGVQPIPHQFPTNPYGMLATPVADIYNFPKKVPGMLGATEGAGGRGLGAMGGGLLGSKWRDPRFIENYETQQGLKPGSLKPVKPPSAEVRPMRELPQAMKDAVQRALKEPSMKGDPLMELAKIAKQGPTSAQMHGAEKISPRASPIGGSGVQRSGKIPLPQEGPTPAQMARPVKQTPEISAKLAEARYKRQVEAGKYEKAQKQQQSLKPLMNMHEAMWKKMKVADRQQWLRDAKWGEWAPDTRMAFILRFMKNGIAGGL